MSRAQWLALLLGVLLVSAPLIRAEAEEEYEDGDDEEEDAGAAKGDAEKDVVVITKANWEEKVKKSKYALVSGTRGHPGHDRGRGRPAGTPARPDRRPAGGAAPRGRAAHARPPLSRPRGPTAVLTRTHAMPPRDPGRSSSTLPGAATAR